MTELDVIKDRIEGTIWGACCGSALGGSCIGLNHKEILATAGVSVLRDFVPGLSRSQLPEHPPGAILADAQMGLALAETLLAGKGTLSVSALRQRFAALLECDDFNNAGPGPLCLASLRRLVDDAELSDDEFESTHVSGAARAFPIGCLPDSKAGSNGNSSSASSDIVTGRTAIAVKQAMLSQKDKSVAAASAVIADIIHHFIKGERLDDEASVRTFVKREFELAQSIEPKFADFWDDVAPDLDYNMPARELPYSLVNVQSNVNECVPTAVGIFLIFRHDPDEAICAAARGGGDTDTAALIVGALSGAYHGAKRLPQRWREKVSHADRIQSVAQGLADLW